MTKGAHALNRYQGSFSDLATTLGVSRAAVSKWRHGKGRPSTLEQRLALERLTGVPAASWLYAHEIAEQARLARLALPEIP